MYKPQNPIRIVTAASLFDGHDASINIMRRVLQDMGAEVIHLGHNRSVQEVVEAALQEGAQGIAVSSYQGGHMEYFKYMKDLLDENKASYVKIYGGGGGVIVHDEKRELEAYGIAQIFHPDDGRKLGLEGMIEQIIKECDFDLVEAAKKAGPLDIAQGIPQREVGVYLTALENSVEYPKPEFATKKQKPLILGITGTGGAGKSSLVDELVQRFLNSYKDINIAVLFVDPTKRKTGGALLGDRIRMNSLSRSGTFMRSMASRGSGNEISKALPFVLEASKSMDFDLIIAESSGIGQSSHAITEISDLSLYVMTSEFGAQSQLEKIEMIDFADVISINKADRRGSQDAFRDVRKQYKRSRKLFQAQDEELPIFLTQASQFNDKGVNELFLHLSSLIKDKDSERPIWKQSQNFDLKGQQKASIVPAERQNYLAEIVSVVRNYKKQVRSKAEVASKLGALKRLGLNNKELNSLIEEYQSKFSQKELEQLESYQDFANTFKQKEFIYQVRGKEIKQTLVHESLSGLDIPRLVAPSLRDWGDRYEFLHLENLPGYFPYTAGVFPLKRLNELPTRMFAGEGTPEKTNKRFHYLCEGQPAKRLSTAFDSVTLYGQDPDKRPDIYGKVGESGVSISTLDDMKRLFAGFDLCDPVTSVSMTINGPAPMILAFYMNTTIDQQVEKRQKELGRVLNNEEHKEIKEKTLQTVRGTVQADILKEDQGQNTCIFSIDFALKMMGDIQQFFTDNKVKNFYSVSISGYHIAEAGANPITQLALTLSNAFTYVEYYLSRGMDINDFAPNLSFFFSNGLDPEYTVIGRVARRIWSIAMRDLYQANDRSQKLKYHIQTSGRSLHAQEIDFNDIRTTLQALTAISDHCNSLHTNAYDEAITTPTEESVRRAQAIQMIINKEYGYTKNENPLQGSYFIQWLTEAVEEAILDEFLKINERGGVLGAMETQYQRGKIQEESLYYEHLKHSGELPIIGVNTYENPKTLEEGYAPETIELRRASVEEKQLQHYRTQEFMKDHKEQAKTALHELKQACLNNLNIFEALMEASRHCTLYQMTQALYEVGGQYRRNI
ncbi:MAG: methylmalonyl-CoA mutase family protein [Bdellovibrionales bacterium]|nr:methylmalonyl-CoA mutase family protein [Bdellovibrionales bacterium]